MDTYSLIDEIPRGTAPDALTDGCLVLEGGAFRGLYTQGFLDAMMLNGLNLSCVVGVSAGALAGMNYVAGQIGRSARINLGFRHDSRYVGTKAMVNSHSLLDIGFLVEERGILEPFDFARFDRPEQRFVAVATNCLDRSLSYFEQGHCSEILSAVRASASMPFISPMVMVEGVPHLDGGCACKIPYRWALDQGFKKIVVIKTQHPDFRKPAEVNNAARYAYYKYPEFAERLANSNLDYNRQCDEIEELHAEGKILRIAPSVPVTVSRLENDLEKLGDLYWIGCADCLDALDSIRTYLAE